MSRKKNRPCYKSSRKSKRKKANRAVRISKFRKRRVQRRAIYAAQQSQLPNQPRIIDEDRSKPSSIVFNNEIENNSSPVTIAPRLQPIERTKSPKSIRPHSTTLSYGALAVSIFYTFCFFKNDFNFKLIFTFQQIMSGVDYDDEPLLQVIYFKLDKAQYNLQLSDGQCYLRDLVLSPAVNNYLKQQCLEKYAVIRLDRFEYKVGFLQT